MKLFVLIWLISYVSCSYFGCPMDGCDSSLSSFVDININGFNKDIQWQYTNLINKTTRGCVSNSRSSLICVIDDGYVGLNITNGQILWSVTIDNDQTSESAALPIVNRIGYSIIANSSRCTLIDPDGNIVGTFNYSPELQSPLAGPFVTNDGQIIVADSVSFVGIEDSGIPLGIHSFPSGYIRYSRSMSLNPQIDRWYLITQQKNSSIQSIIAAETTGSIVERLHIAWIYQYENQSNNCNGKEGPLLFIDQQYLFVINSTGIVTISDDGSSASTKYFVKYPNICTNHMAFSESDSTLLIIDKNQLNLLIYNISTQDLSNISFSTIYGNEIIGQLSRLSVIDNHRMIVVVVTAVHKGVLLLFDYKQKKLLSNFDLGNVYETKFDEFSQLTYTKLDDEHVYVTFAHQSVGLITIRLD